MTKPTATTPGVLSPLDERAAALKAEAAKKSAEAERVAAEGRAAEKIQAPLATILSVLAEFPDLTPLVIATIEAQKGAGKPEAPRREEEEVDFANSEEVASDLKTVMESLLNPDRMAVFLLSVGNRPVKLEEFYDGTGLPKSSVKNVLYMKNDGRFAKLESEDGPMLWRLSNLEMERRLFPKVGPKDGIWHTDGRRHAHRRAE